MTEKITITNEAQAWDLLSRATTDGMPDDVELVFDGWPTFKMGVQGKDWHSTVPTRVMSPLLDVQKDINRAYANVRYGAGDTRKLKDEERDELEVVVKVSEGSSLYDAELWKQFSTIAEAAVGRMNGTETTITVLGLAMLVAAPVMYKAWLASRQKEKEFDHQLQMSQEESRRLEIFSEALSRQIEIDGIPNAKAAKLFETVAVEAKRIRIAQLIGNFATAIEPVVSWVANARAASKQQFQSKGCLIFFVRSATSASVRLNLKRTCDSLTGVSEGLAILMSFLAGVSSLLRRFIAFKMLDLPDSFMPTKISA